MPTTAGMGSPEWPWPPTVDNTTIQQNSENDYYVCVEKLRNRVAREIADEIEHGRLITSRIENDLLPVYRWLDTVLREKVLRENDDN